MKKVYEPFLAPIMVTDVNSAELIKHAANSFLALKISYINVISAIYEASGANVGEVAAGIGVEAVRNAEALVLATEWSEFRDADFTLVKELMHSPIIFDGRNHLDREMLVGMGFDYFGIGC
jgi:UDP-glucose 6-dehydrogenase